MKEKKEQLLYLIQDCTTERIKIGISLNPRKRLKSLQTGSPNKLKLLGIYTGGRPLEKRLHKMFFESRLRSNGEWFEFNPIDSYLSFIQDELLKEFEVEKCHSI